MRTVDRWLENRYAKILTDPLLSFTERSIDYWLPLTSINIFILECWGFSFFLHIKHKENFLVKLK